MIKKLLTLIYLTLFFVPIKAEVLKELIIEGNSFNLFLNFITGKILESTLLKFKFLIFDLFL